MANPEVSTAHLDGAAELAPEAGLRPLPWPLWTGRHGNLRAAAITTLFWGGSLGVALALQSLGGDAQSLPSLALFATMAPWSMAVLWLLFGNYGLAALLLTLCALLVPGGATLAAFEVSVFSGLVAAFAPAVALAVMAVLLRALAVDPLLRSLPSLGLFLFTSFCAADMASISRLLLTDETALLRWEQYWLAHLLQDGLITTPLIVAAGAFIERGKRSLFGSLPLARASRTQQLVGILAGLACLVAFCITWTLGAAMPLTLSISSIADPTLRVALEQDHRTAALHYGALVAMLLGTVCGGASMVFLLLRRYREELRLEVSRSTEALRRRHLQMATLQQVTEAASRSLDPAAVYQEMGQTLARLTDAAQVAVYVPDDLAQLKLIHKVSIRPAEFEHRLRLPIESTLTGHCFRSRAILSVPNNLPVYMEPEKLREQFQTHGLDAFLAIPIMGENSIHGVVSLSFDTPFAPDDEEQRLFKLIGRAIGGALERAETYARSRRYAEELGGLYRFSQQLAVESEEPRLLAIAAAAVRDLLSAQGAAILVRSGEGDEVVIRCAAFEGSSAGFPAVRDLVLREDEPGLIGEAMREGRSILAGGKLEAEMRQVLAKGWTVLNALIVPLPPLTPERKGVTGAMVLTLEPGTLIGLEESGLAEEIARQTSAGLRRTRLIAQTRAQAAELKLLEQIGRLLSQRLNIASTLDQLVQNVNKFVNARWASVFMHDPDSQTLRIAATTFAQPQIKSLVIPLRETSLLSLCFKEGRTVHSPDTLHDPRCNTELNRLYGAASALAVPLGLPSQRFGVLVVHSAVIGSFSHEDERRLEQLAQLASAAIERAKLYEEACQRADELILLNEVGHLLVENPALESTLCRIAELVCRNLEVGDAGFLLLNRTRDMLVARGMAGTHAYELQHARVSLDGDDLLTAAFRLNEPQVSENARHDPRIPPRIFERVPTLASAAVVPMAGGTGGPMGVLAVWKDKPYRFQPRDVQCLAAVARLAAAAVGRDELGQALRASEARLKEVVDGLEALIFSIDVHGVILSFNAAAEKLSGLPREAALGRNLAEVISGNAQEQARIYAFVRNAFQNADCSRELAINWDAHEGKQRKIRITSSFLRDAENHVTGMVCMGVDITDQVLLEAQLLQAQKMESVGALAGGMAHDFNNLLGGIIGQCAIARAQPSADQLLVSCLSKIEAAAQRGADLTSKLMAFARKSVLQPRAIDIGALIHETAELLSGSLPRTIDIVTNIATDLPWVHGDPTQLQQVLLNLCVNARDAMPSGGRLRLSASSLSEQSAAGKPPVLMPMSVLVEVSDTGAGMSEEVQQRLFEPFFTTKELGKGTGLGLSVVFGIVRSHGGQITVHSQLNKGTKFSIRLPVAPPLRTRKRPRVSGETSGHLPAVVVRSGLHDSVPFAGKEDLLLIDDDSMLRETTRQLLENLGYRVRTASSGLEALQILEEAITPKPACVLLDVVMPGLAGPPLYAELRKRTREAPVILMSGYSADQTVTDMLEAGASELVQKPFSMEALAAAIRRNIDRGKQA